MRLIFGVLLLLVASGGAKAGFEFQIDLDMPFSNTLAGQTVQRDVFLVEQPGSSTWVASNFIEFNILAGAGGTTITDFLPNTAFVGNPFLTPPQVTGSTPIAGGEAVRLYSFINVVPVAGRVLLGQVELKLGTFGSSTPLTFVDPGTSGYSGDDRNVLAFLTGSGATPQLLDGDVFGANSFSGSAIVAVPEPSSAVLVTAVGLVGLFRRRRKA